MSNPWIVEAKVIASTAMSAGIGITIGVLNDIETNNSLLDPIPHSLQAVVLVAIPTVLTFLAGFRARHTSRPDLSE